MEKQRKYQPDNNKRFKDIKPKIEEIFSKKIKELLKKLKEKGLEKEPKFIKKNISLMTKETILSNGLKINNKELLKEYFYFFENVKEEEQDYFKEYSLLLAKIAKGIDNIKMSRAEIRKIGSTLLLAIPNKEERLDVIKKAEDLIKKHIYPLPFIEMIRMNREIMGDQFSRYNYLFYSYNIIIRSTIEKKVKNEQEELWNLIVIDSNKLFYRIKAKYNDINKLEETVDNLLYLARNLDKKIDLARMVDWLIDNRSTFDNLTKIIEIAENMKVKNKGKAIILLSNILENSGEKGLNEVEKEIYKLNEKEQKFIVDNHYLIKGIKDLKTMKKVIEDIENLTKWKQ